MKRIWTIVAATIVTAGIGATGAASVASHLAERDHHDAMECLARASLTYKPGEPAEEEFSFGGEKDSMWWRDEKPAKGVSFQQASAKRAKYEASRC